MPLDAVCLQAVVAELSPLVAGSRIEKIQQPARDQVVLLLRGSRRLLAAVRRARAIRDCPSHNTRAQLHTDRAAAAAARLGLRYQQGPRADWQ